MEFDRKEAILVVILLVLFSLPIWIVAYPPLSDYPSHLLSIFIAHEYDNPAFNFQDNFVAKWRPLPNIGSEVAIFLLAKVLAIETAGRVYLTFFLILFVVGIFYFIDAVDSRKRVLGFFGFLFAYNWYFHQGYINFYGSLSLFFLGLGLWYRSGSLALFREKLLLSILLVTIFFFHLVAWLALVGSILILGLSEKEHRRKLINAAIALVPSLLLVFNYFLFLRGGSSMQAGAQFLNPYENLTFAVTHTLVDFSRWDLLLYIPAIGFVGYLLARDHILRRETVDRGSRRLVWLAICFAAAFFVLPLQISGVWPFNLRLNLFLLFVALASMPVGTVQRFKTRLLATAVLLSLASLGNVWWHYDRVSRQIETYVSGIDHVEANKNILPLTMDITSGWAHIPISTVWAYYHMKKGGAGPYLFNLPHGQIVNYRRPKNEQFPAPNLYPHRVNDYRSERHSAPYDYVLLWGFEESIEHEISRDFRPVFENGQLTVYKRN